MKVNKITTQPEFQPVTLQITIESQEEFDLLKTLFATNETVPEAMFEEGYISKTKRDILSELMGNVHNVF